MQFFKQARGILFKWLNRRRQRCSYNWRGIRELIELFRIERPRIVGRPKTEGQLPWLEVDCGTEYS